MSCAVVTARVHVCLAAILAGLLAALGAAPALGAPSFFQLHHRFARPPSERQCRRVFGAPCYRPAQLRRAYDLQPLYSAGLDGRGRTIVIVDSFGSPTIRHDLTMFDRAFGIPDPLLAIIQPAGRVPAFRAHDPERLGWAGETTLDVEYAHAIAPGARILLVETPVAETEGVAGFPQIVEAETYVINHGLGDVISQSFGATEQTFPNRRALLALRGALRDAARHGVSVLAASGDDGAAARRLNGNDFYPFPANTWPSSDPLVTSVGGTRMFLSAAGVRRAADVVWNHESPLGSSGASGGGVSAVFTRPRFQDGVARVVGRRRGTPDVSLNAANSGAVLTYMSFPDPGLPPGWYPSGGTSEAVQLFGAIVAIADQAAGHRLGRLGGALYALGAQRAPGLIDITRGDNAITLAQSSGRRLHVSGYRAGRGYDLASGLGTVDAAQLVAELRLR